MKLCERCNLYPAADTAMEVPKCFECLHEIERQLGALAVETQVEVDRWHRRVGKLRAPRKARSS